MEEIRGSERVLVLTGAGISAESGVPTFRGGGGSAVWKGMELQQISSAQMVQEDLAEVWEWFDYRRGVLAECEPNEAHHDLVKLEAGVEEFLLVTQNVDGLHSRAGSKNVIEIHGNINRARCTVCEKKVDLNWDQIPHDPDICGACESKLRPDVVLFGESLPEGAFEEALQFAETADLCIVVGTSAEVYPAAAIPGIAQRAGAKLVEVNPEFTGLSSIADITVSEAATIGVSGVVEQILEGKN